MHVESRVEITLENLQNLILTEHVNQPHKVWSPAKTTVLAIYSSLAAGCSQKVKRVSKFSKI